MTAALILALGAAGTAPASAAPPTAPWSGSAGGDVANLTTTAVGLNLAGARLAVSDAASGSALSPRARATSSNLGATVVGLPVAVASTSQTAPPDAGGPVTSPVVGLDVPTLLSLGALTTTNDANWSVDTACVTNGVLASSSTQTAGLSVLPLVGGGVVALGVSQTDGQTALVQNTGLNHGVQSTASGTISGLSILGGLVGVGVTGTTTLTATATGNGTATVAYSPASVTVTAAGTTVALTPAQPSRTVSLLGLGTVTVALNTPTTTTTATSATATSTLLTVSVGLPLLATQVTLGVLPLRATATVPAGGIDCPPAPPVITSPVNGATTNATPAISGTAVAGATVNVLVDGASIGTTTANGAGNWTVTPSTPLTPGAHTATAIQTVAGTPSLASAAVAFTVDTTPPPPPVITAPANGSTQTSRQPAIVGTAEANSTVTVTIDGAVAGTTPANASGAWTFTPPVPLADGSHSASARATDAAGNVSTVSNTTTFTIDATSPPAPVITAPANGSSTNDTTPTFTGTAEANTIVTVLVDGAVIGTAPSDGSGGWSFTPTTPLAAGLRTATATATDAAGNVSPASAPVSFTIDATAPPAPIITSPTNGSTVPTATPAITGTAEANTTVSVTIDGAVVGTAPANASGAWSFTPATLAPGPHTTSATATDAAGNVSPSSATVAFTVDTTAPAAPVITSPEPGDVTNDPTPAISGTAEANAIVSVSIDGVVVGTTSADAAGDWLFTPTAALVDGPHTATARATDAAGNVSPASVAVTFVVDTAVPAAPVITSPIDGSTVADTTPAIVGTAEANSVVLVTIDGGTAGAAQADAAGAWTLTPVTPLAPGAHTVSATAIDVGGNVSAPSATVSFIVDTAPPAAPVIESPLDGTTTADPTPEITGTAEPDSTVTVLVDGDEVGTAAADGAGNWTFTPATPLTNGAHTLTATATDAGGNESPASAPVDITVDTGAPDAPVITSPESGESLTDTTPPIVGTSEPNTTVTVSIDGTVVGTAAADGSGAWTLTFTDPLAEGPHDVSAFATDAGGNASPANPPVPFTIDTTAPLAPAITAPAAGSTVADTTPDIIGTAEANSTVTVTIDGAVAGTTPADGTGAWSFTPAAALAQGAHTVSATATDAAGLTGPASATVPFTVDTVAPGAPVITTPTAGARVSDTTPDIIGTAEANSTVTVTIDGVVAGTTIASGLGAWTFTPTVALIAGPHTVSATATDAGGSTGPASVTVPFTVDTVAPGAPVITAPEEGSTTADSTPEIEGTAEADSTVNVTIDGTLAGTALAGSTGAWTFTPAPLSNASHTVSATATDAAGNTGPASATTTFTVDGIAPAAPVISTPEDGSVVATRTPTISGTAEANSTVLVTIDGVVAGTAPVDGTGGWSFSPTAPLADGPHTVSATATDAADNTSPPSALVSFRVDATAPAAPIITSPEEGDVTSDPTPTITGTAEPDATVTVTIDGAVAGSVTAGGTGAWLFTAALLADGPHTTSATARDAAGNTGPASATVSFDVDTTAPDAPIVTTPADGSTTPDTTPAVTGTAEAASVVTVSIDGAIVGTTVADGSGGWGFTPTTPLADGSHSAAATAQDAAGNVSAVSNTVTFTVDATAPPAPVVTAPEDGSTIADTTPEITGTAEPDAIVTITIDGAVAGTTVATAGGAWTFTPPTPLAEGTRTVSATATDSAGNDSPASADVTFTIDATAPAAPSITAPEDGDTLSDPTPAVTGTAEPGSLVTVRIDGTEAGTAEADEDGDWTFTPTTPLTNGPHTIDAVATDAAGNESPASEPVDVTVDTGAPDAPIITSPASGTTVTDSTPEIVGSAEADTTVTVSIDGAVVGTTTAGPGGAWTFVPTMPLGEGPHTVTATATDSGGNTSPANPPVPFRVDTLAPPAPVVTAPANGSVSNDASPTISGTAEGNATVTVTLDGVVVGTAVADADGRWELPVGPLGDGPHTVSAVAADAAGNTGPASTEVAFTIDTAPPAAPDIDTPATGTTVTDSTPTLTGTAEPGSTVTVAIDGTVVGTTTADGSGAWTFTPTAPLPDGPHTAAATATDAAGNTSPASPITSFAVDATAPAPPIISSPSDGASTADTTPTIAGTAEANATVSVSIDGTIVGEVTADATGAWSYTPATPLAQGGHSVSATATDAAGNTGARSAVVSFTVDDVAPPAPVITTPANGATTGATPRIGGTAEANALVTVTIDGTVAGTTTADGTGAWSFTPSPPLAEGGHVTTATATDAAGNASDLSNSVEFVVDAVAPAAPVITGPADGSTGTDPRPPISGTAEPGSTVTIVIDGRPVGTVVAGPSGGWTFTPTQPLGNGSHTITATATDPAGNVSPASAPVRLTVASPSPGAGGLMPPTGGSGVAVPAGMLGLALLVFGAALLGGGRRSRTGRK